MISVYEAGKIFRLDRKGKIVNSRLPERDSIQWKNVADGIQSELQLKRAIVIDDVTITVLVQKAEGLRSVIMDDGIQCEQMVSPNFLSSY